jgi:2-keto-4-pentenoate hydratase/2-oxohepta-3-ene-1,7-dioic acid hydratase in catechol pathway
MILSKVKIGDENIWIEKSEDEYYQLIADEQNCRFDRAKKLKLSNDFKFHYINPFWGKNVFGLAFNYKSLVGKKDEYEEPLIFMKSSNSISSHGSSIKYPPDIKKVWVEVELVMIISKECKDVSEHKAKDYIFGYTTGSDITAQNIYGRDHHLARSKALDNFAPIGPWINTNIDTDNLQLETYINDQQFQLGNTSDRILNDYKAVALVSEYFTLSPGDIIFTGTPANAMNSIVKPGDSVTHKIQGFDKLIFSIDKGSE